MKASIIVDLGFGDAGKGSLVDYLVRRDNVHTVIRFNGGAQAAHNVVLPDGRHHTFSQFGSGTFVPGVRTHLSRFMLVDPVALVQEERHLRALGICDAFDRLSIDQGAIVVTPFQKAANRLRELSRGDGRHGSCGMGIGETMADRLADPTQVLFVRDFLDPPSLQQKLQHLQDLKRRAIALLPLPTSPSVDREIALLNDPSAVREFASLFTAVGSCFSITHNSLEVLSTPGNVVFEGAQGVLIDEWFGFHPYTTWSTTTFTNALTLLTESSYPGEITKIGMTRAYMVRHGPGPLVTEDPEIAHSLTEPHNRPNPWQRDFRMGWLDFIMLRYALEVVGGVDQLALTCLDHLPKLKHLKVCHTYHDPPSEFFEKFNLQKSRLPDLVRQERITAALMHCRPHLEKIPLNELPRFVENALNLPVNICSYGPTHKDKISAVSSNLKPVEA